jgi:hypothetical protein
MPVITVGVFGLISLLHMHIFLTKFGFVNPVVLRFVSDPTKHEEIMQLAISATEEAHGDGDHN